MPQVFLCNKTPDHKELLNSKNFKFCEAIDYFKDCPSRTNIHNNIFEGHCLILTCRKKLIGTGILIGSNARRVFLKPLYQKMGV